MCDVNHSLFLIAGLSSQSVALLAVYVYFDMQMCWCLLLWMFFLLTCTLMLMLSLSSYCTLCLSVCFSSVDVSAVDLLVVFCGASVGMVVFL